MRIFVDFYVEATGRPKGYQNTRRIFGVVTSDFDIARDDSPMIKVIEVTRSNQVFEYFQNGDGSFYQKASFEGAMHEECHIPYRYSKTKNVFGQDLHRADKYRLGSLSHTEAAAEWFPKNAKAMAASDYNRDHMINIDQMNISDLVIKNYVDAKRQIASDIKAHLVHEGQLFKRVPEPVYALQLEQGYDLMGSIKIGLRMPPDLKGLRNSHFSPQDIAIASLAELEKLQELAQELSEKHGITRVHLNPHDDSYGRVQNYNPITSYADSMILYHTASLMRESAIRKILSKPGSVDHASSHLADWPVEAFATFKGIETLLVDETWFDKADALHDLIERCFEIDKQRAIPIFTTPEHSTKHKIDFNFLREQCQTRSFNLGGLGF